MRRSRKPGPEPESMPGVDVQRFVPQGKRSPRRIGRNGTVVTSHGDGSASVGLSQNGRFSRSPSLAIAKAIRDALNPTKQPSRVRTLADMTPEEREEMRRLYAPKSKAPKGGP